MLEEFTAKAHLKPAYTVALLAFYRSNRDAQWSKHQPPLRD
jgi:hypothetical protein